MLNVNIRNEAQELLDNLRDIVYEDYIKGKIHDLKYQDVRKIDNDLGYIIAAVDDEDNLTCLLKYKKLISKYEKQLKSAV